MILGDDAIELGRVVRLHGTGGDIVVAVDAADAATLLAARRVLLDAEPGLIPYHVAAARPAPGSAPPPPRDAADAALGPRELRIRLSLVGIASRDAAQPWLGGRLLIDRRDLPEIERDTGDLRWSDLVGLRCETTAGETLGTVREIWPTPGYDQLLVEGPAGSFFLPALDSVLVETDLAAGVLRFELPEGLLAPEAGGGAEPSPGGRGGRGPGA